MICPICGKEHPDGVQFCPLTGQPIPRPPVSPPAQPQAGSVSPGSNAPVSCPHCGAALPPGVRFCPTCGRPLAGSPPVPPPWPPPAPPPKTGMPGWMLWSGLGFLAVVLVGALVWWLVWGNEDGRGLSLSEATDIPRVASTTTNDSIAGGIIGTLNAPGDSNRTAAAVTEAPVREEPTRSVASPVPRATFTALPSSTPLPTVTPLPSPTPVPAATPLGGGGKIAFSRGAQGAGDIFIMDSDGYAQTQLTFERSDQAAPSWSPDGTRLAFQSNEGGDYELVILDVQSGRQTAVTRNNCNDFNPTWSPDGTRLAFYSDCDGNREIYIINVDGSERTQLTNTRDTYNWFPAWAPDGQRITYSSNQPGKYHVFVMDIASRSAAPLQPGCKSVFSPDGAWITFTSYCSDPGEIMVMRADGRGLETLPTNGNSTNPNWSPDGRWIVYQSQVGSNDEIFIMDADGESIVQLTENPARDGAPVWQPNPTP